EAAGGAAEQHGLELAAARHAAGQLQELPQRDAERHLVDARLGDVPRQAEELGALRALGADLRVAGPRGEHDVEHVDERLDVVDDGRLAEEAGHDGERGLRARLAAEALDRVEDRRLLAADVGAAALADLDVEGEAVAADVGPEQLALARL